MVLGGSPIRRGLSPWLRWSVVQCVHTPCPRGPISGPLTKPPSPSGAGWSPMAGHGATEDTTGTHGWAECHVHHTSTAARGLRDCPEEDVPPGGGGGSAGEGRGRVVVVPGGRGAHGGRHMVTER